MLDFSKLKAFADDKIRVSVREENIVGKGENAGYQHFLLFPNNVFKSLLSQGIVYRKGLILHNTTRRKKIFENVINSLPHDKILAIPKLKTFADDKFDVDKMMISVFDKVVNIMGKGKKSGYKFLF